MKAVAPDSADTLRFGAIIPSLDANVGRTAAAMEGQGWDVLATGEHVSFNVPTANAFVSLAAAASVTSRVQLMSTMSMVPLYPPGLVAKMAAALDNVSAGRFILGAGLGGENPEEFASCGVPVEQRASRMDESLAAMRQLWSGREESFHGRHVNFDRVRIAPPPVQPGGPPIWVAGRKEVAMRRAARWGDGWMPYMFTPDMLADSIETIARHREAPRPVRSGIFLWSCVHDDPRTALAYAQQSLGKTYKQDFTHLAGRYLAVGTPHDVATRVIQYVDAGARLIVFGSACPPEHVDRSLELLIREVVPLVRMRVG